MKLIGPMPQHSWGKILQILLGGKTVVRACVHAAECERGAPQQLVLRVYGYNAYMCKLWHTNNIQSCANERERREGKRKIQTNPLDALASQGRGQSQPQGFPTLVGGAAKLPDQHQHPGRCMERASLWSILEAKQIKNKHRQRANRKEGEEGGQKQ